RMGSARPRGPASIIASLPYDGRSSRASSTIRSCRSHRAAVADDLAGLDVDDVLGDVRAVVADPLQVLGDHDVREVAIDMRALPPHVRQRLLHDPRVQGI